MNPSLCPVEIVGESSRTIREFKLVKKLSGNCRGIVGELSGNRRGIVGELSGNCRGIGES